MLYITNSRGNNNKAKAKAAQDIASRVSILGDQQFECFIIVESNNNCHCQKNPLDTYK